MHEGKIKCEGREGKKLRGEMKGTTFRRKITGKGRKLEGANGADGKNQMREGENNMWMLGNQGLQGK